MKTTLLLLFSLLLAVACHPNESTVAPPVVTTPPAQAEDPNWIRLDIPTGREAYAIAGDIDKTLLVTTWSKAYYTTDQGKTWQLAKDFQGPVPGLLIRNDTTFALHAKRFDRQGNLLGAWDALYGSADYGKTWFDYLRVYKTYLDDIQPIGSVIAAAGTRYRITEQLTPVSPGSGSFYINPSVLTREDASGIHTLTLPVPLRLINLYLDGQNRLYVAASGSTYQPATSTFYCCTPDMPAVVYVSRRPLP